MSRDAHEFLLVGEANMEIADSVGQTLPPLPAGSIIRIHVAEPDRLALDIPPGRKAASLGCFAILWNGFIGVFTVIVGLISLDGKNREFSVVAMLFLSVFWLIGLGLIYAWVKMRFERSLLFVDRERAVLRSILFGRQKQKEVVLNETSRAELTESYRENERPVYRVTIHGADGARIHFGTSLDHRDKDWCVDAINAVLQPRITTASEASDGPLRCEACGAVFPADANHTVTGDVICPGCSHQQTIQPADSSGGYRHST